MAMMSSITVGSCPWGRLGTAKLWATSPTGGWTSRKSGITRSENATSVRQSRSKRRKLPVLTAPMTTTAARITVGTLGRPR